MIRLARISSVATGLGVTAGILASRATAKWFEDQNVREVIILASSVVIVAVLAQLFRIVITYVILNFRFTRRLILGRQYIEGIWIDLMEENGNPVSLGLTRINIIDGELKINGDDYDTEGMHTGYYSWEFFKYDWPRINYVYSYHRSDDNEVIRLGYGEILFDDIGGTPFRYTGHYIDLKKGEQSRFEGWKLKDRNQMKKLNTPAGREAVVRDWYQELLEKKSSYNNDH